MTTLFSPIKIGPYTLPHRVFMAPLTRCRADEPGRVPNALMAEYYRQRSGPDGAALIISEATQISPVGVGYPGTPGIHSSEQIKGWRRVTDAVHAAGGRIFCQLWHVGRVSHSRYQPHGAVPVSSSAVAKAGEIMLPDGTMDAYPVPRSLSVEEIRATIADYRRAAENALAAGFDGVELHGANGYLPDQFLRDGVNRRTDEYGGAIENRSRFHLEATRALCEVWGAARVGIRLSPSGTFNDMRDSNPRSTFAYVITELGRMGLAYLHIMEAMEGDLRHGQVDPTYEAIPVSAFRPMFKGPLVTNSMFNFEKAAGYAEQGSADAVAFGTLFIANPDLSGRFRRFGKHAPLNAPDVQTFYSPGPKGYTDYPVLDASGVPSPGATQELERTQQ